MSRADYYDELYRECIPTRPTPADPCRMALGPSAQFELLELECAQWQPEVIVEPGFEAGAA